MKWKLERENESAEWKFAGQTGEEPTKRVPPSQLVSNLSFTDVLDPQTQQKQMVSTTRDRDNGTFDGFSYTLTANRVAKPPALCSMRQRCPCARQPSA
jgi:hypothetical protein